MAHGHEDRMAREAYTGLIHRKAGVNILPRVAVGGDYAAIARIERMRKMPDGALLIVQDERGNFVYMPGIDGPSLGSG